MTDKSQTTIPKVDNDNPIWNSLPAHTNLPFDAMVRCVADGCNNWVFCGHYQNASDCICESCLND